MSPHPISSLELLARSHQREVSGALDRSSTTPQLPPSSLVTFSAPGTYQFYCMIHPFMHGTVTVTP